MPPVRLRASPIHLKACWVHPGIGQVSLGTCLAFALHGLFILSARYRLSYDAYTHMFFGDHYRLNWWSLWDSRWYTGFEVSSYPPLVHQIIGLLGRAMGVEAAFALLLWVVLCAYPAAVYAFSRIFTGKTAAGYAALAGAVLPSIYQTAHTFGQLPTLTATLLALFGMAALDDFLRKGNRLSGTLAVALVGAVAAAHHATLLFLPFSTGAVLLQALLTTSLPRLKLLWRAVVFGVLSAVTGLLVIWPFWLWGLGQTMQTPIAHLSRHNFLADPAAALMFFWPVYGPLAALIPFALWKGFRRRYGGLWAAFGCLFLLGLGGTTPLPGLLFGAHWEWLTYDRFAFWASLLLLPFFGMAVILVCHRRSVARRRIWVLSLFSLLGLASLLAGFLPTLLPTQPAALDMKPILAFLAQGERSKWRYLTFGFGDQFAALSIQTQATTIDGSYHTARLLPELRSSGLGQIDAAYWLPDGLVKLDPILQKSAQWGVRWGFVNLKKYIPLLKQNGWVHLATLSNGVGVWENPRALVSPPVQPPPENPLAVFSWGVLPLLSLCAAGSLAAVRLQPLAARKALFGLHFVALGLLPLGLCFWYFRPLALIDHPRVYFTYDQALFYVSDGLAGIAFLAWVIGRAGAPTLPETRPARPFFLRIDFWLLGLCLLATLSSLWAIDWRVSLCASLQLWLVLGLFHSLQDRPDSWRALAWGSFAALVLQAVIGLWQFGVQSTAFLKPLGLNWPGILSNLTGAASVVQLLDGARWLRAYGSLPHPNILAGLVFGFLALGSAFFLLSPKPRPLALLVLAPGLVLFVLTFSRSAWLALAAFGLVLALRFRRFERKRLLILAFSAVFCLAAAVLALWPLVFARSASPASHTEAFSLIGRTWLAQEGWLFIRERPLLGLGTGGFVLALAQRAGPGYITEPVHNLALLVTSELGLLGGLFLAGLALLVARAAILARSPETVLFSALVLGFGVIGLFDHYLWTLAPGRILVGLSLGLLAGRMRLDASSR